MAQFLGKPNKPKTNEEKYFDGFLYRKKVELGDTTINLAFADPAPAICLHYQ